MSTVWGVHSETLRLRPQPFILRPSGLTAHGTSRRVMTRYLDMTSLIVI